MKHFVALILLLSVTVQGLYGIRLSLSQPRLWKFEDSQKGPSEEKPQREEEKPEPEIYALHIKSNIFSRFATTLVTSRLANRHGNPSEAVFIVQLPDAAFISNFSMEMDGKVIIGEVKEKEQAKEEYERAKSLGQSTGHIAQAPRETNTFHISVNVAAMGKVTFNLTYQEILQRVHGLYKHIVNIQPGGQIVKDLKVDVFITEAKEINTVHVPEFGEKVGEKANQDLIKLPEAQGVKIKSAITPQISHVHVMYHPNPRKQKSIKKDSNKALVGQLVVLYDVARDQTGGDVQVVNGYFVHFFAPSNISVSNKHAIFVLDTSGSMRGRKIQQTKDAMTVILQDLREDDLFNIMEFDDLVRPWKSESVYATEANIKDATKFVQQLLANGGTNINEALKTSVKNLLSNIVSNRNPVIIFLTDGQATTGITANQKILDNVEEMNDEGKVSIQTIGFGRGADFNLMKRLSLDNHGLARKIYEDSDAALQLQGFYAEISSLLLTDVKIKYLNETVEPDSIVQDSTYNYYDGSEFIIVGKVQGPKFQMTNFDVEIRGSSSSGEQTFHASGRRVCEFPLPSPRGEIGQCLPWVLPAPPTTLPEYKALPPETIGGFVERMWAYLSIKKLLEKSKYDSKINKTDVRQKALELSLKYHFVTELTSMVVTQPDGNKTQTLTKGIKPQVPSSSYNYGTYGRGSGISSVRTGSRGGLNYAKLPGRGPYADLTQNSHRRKIALGHPTTTTRRPLVCSGNETLAGDSCEAGCNETYTKGQSCPANGTCNCDLGHLRSPGGNCVKPLDCPNAPKRCTDPNAFVSLCGKACEQKTCHSLTINTDCQLCGPVACVCNQGYALNENKICVPQSDCDDSFEAFFL